MRLNVLMPLYNRHLTLVQSPVFSSPLLHIILYTHRLYYIHCSLLPQPYPLHLPPHVHHHHPHHNLQPLSHNHLNLLLLVLWSLTPSLAYASLGLNLTLILSYTEPSSVEKALANPRRFEAIKAEYDAHQRNKTWTLIPLP